jgi:CDP-diacylglycerol---glycerol-3-phosphate 3-phosphatidyltransferase
MSQHPVWNIPNGLSMSRIPLAVALFVAISHEAWDIGLGLFLIAVWTDWADGWWARKFGPLSMIGRSLDPLTDKVLLGGAFIYFIPVDEVSITPWMTTLIICRELLVTGIRGIVESTGQKFGADWLGKLKTILQCIVIIAALLMLGSLHGMLENVIPVSTVYLTLLYAMLVVTVLSGLQYFVKAARMLGDQKASSAA